MADIFVSYARQDREQVKRIVELLKSQSDLQSNKNWSVWWDTDLLAGEIWDKVIPRELANARCVLVIWSRESVTHQLVREEAHIAREQSKLIPLTIDGFERPYGFRSIQTTDLSHWLQDSNNSAPVSQLVDAVRTMLAQKPSNDGATVPSDAESPPLRDATHVASAPSVTATQVSIEHPDPHPARSLDLFPTPAHITKPFGRSLKDFRDQKTPSGLLPAEEKLLASAVKGLTCSFQNYSKTRTIRDELNEAVTERPEILTLATDIMAAPSKIFAPRWDEFPADRNVREVLEARIAPLNRIVRELLTELPDFVNTNAAIKEEWGKKVADDTLRSILIQLQQRLESQLWQWRQVDPEDTEVRIRGGLLRFLALGGDNTAPIHEKGLDISAAYILGPLDLTGCKNVCRLRIVNSIFSDRIILSDAETRSVVLSGSRASGISGGHCRIDGSIVLDEGFFSTGSLNFGGARITGTFLAQDSSFRSGLNLANACISGDTMLRSLDTTGSIMLGGSSIGGDLDCNKSNFRNRTDDGTGRALDCWSSKIAGNVYLGECNVEGRVVFLGAQIGGMMSFAGGRFRNRMPKDQHPTIQCQNAEIGRIVFQTDGFVAEGGVGFGAARIGDSLVCSDAKYINEMPSNTVDRHLMVGQRLCDDALDLSRCTIAGTLMLGPNREKKDSKPASVVGSMNLINACVQTLDDCEESWPNRIIRTAEGQELVCAVSLDGFVYDRFSDNAPTYARDLNGKKGRLSWLELQLPHHPFGEFRPQPFEQLASVLKRMGYEAESHDVIAAKNKAIRRARAVSARRDLMETPRTWKAVLKKIGLGFRYIAVTVGSLFQWLIHEVLLRGKHSAAWPISVLLLMLFGFALHYQNAYDQGAIVRTDSAQQVATSVLDQCKTDKDCSGALSRERTRDGNQASHAAHQFNAIRYSLDNMILIANFGRRGHWRPIPGAVKHNILGLTEVTLPPSTTLIVSWFQSVTSAALAFIIAATTIGFIRRS